MDRKLFFERFYYDKVLLRKVFYQMRIRSTNNFLCTNLGNMYKNGNGVEQSYEKAAELFQQAADLGYADAKTQLDELNKNIKTE